MKKLILFVTILFGYHQIQAQDSKETLQDWTSYSQAISIAEKSGYQFRASVAIRKEVTSKAAKASLWVRVDKKNGKTGFFQNNVYSDLIVTNQWKIFTIEGVIDTEADMLNIGAFVMNSGDFYFDEFKLEVRKGKEKWKAINLNNSGFEENITNETNWKNGIGRNNIFTVKNFSIDYTNNNPYKGKNSLLIKGKSILGSSESGKYMDVNGVSLYYEIYGEGEPLLMIHGNGNSMGGFAGNVEELSKYYKVIFVDCRGRGASTYDKNIELTFDLQIEDLKQFLDKLNISKTHIVGWSDGGILALLMAIQHPEKVDKIVSMAGNIFPEGCVDLDKMKEIRDNLVKNNVNHKNDLAIDLYNLDINYPNLKYEDLKVIKSKTLIMAGDHDEIKNEHTLKMFEAIPNAQLAIVPNANHYLPSNNPKLFNEIVLRFLK